MATLLIGTSPDAVTFLSSFTIKSLCKRVIPCNSFLKSLAVAPDHVLRLSLACFIIALSLFLVCGAITTASPALLCLNSIFLNCFAAFRITSLYVTAYFFATALLKRLRSIVSLKNTSGIDIH